MTIIFFKIAAVLGLVGLNGFFVAAEFALVKVRETRLAELAAAGNFRAKIARRLVGNLDAYLSATQLGITLASLALGWMGEPLVSEPLEPLLRRLGVTSHTLATSIAVAVGFILISSLHIVFGEQAPKSLAIRRTEGAVLWIALPLRVFHFVFFPAIWLLNTAAVGAISLLGIKPATEEELAHSQAELQMLLSASARGGQISEQEKKISARALRFADLRARQIMVPRHEVVYLSLADPLETNLAKARTNNFARYPLCEKGLDTVVGMVHLRDLLWMVQDGKASDLRGIAHELLLFSEDETLEAMLTRFKQAHIHLALVVDESGVVSGIVTLENVIEQLVGPIQDEFDEETPRLKRIGPEVYSAAGNAPLTLLREKFGLPFSDPEVATLSGYLTKELGRFPQEGDALSIGEWQVTVTKADALAVKTCRLEKRKEEVV